MSVRGGVALLLCIQASFWFVLSGCACTTTTSIDGRRETDESRRVAQHVRVGEVQESCRLMAYSLVSTGALVVGLCDPGIGSPTEWRWDGSLVALKR